MSEAQIKTKKKNDEELVNHLLKLKESSLNLIIMKSTGTWDLENTKKSGAIIFSQLKS